MNSPGTILIVDDTLASLQLLADLLKAEGYTVRAAQSGELALQSALNNPPELILLDLRMPVMDGFEVCRRLKADPATADIPVIFLSAEHDTPERVQGLALGAVDYLGKPFQREELLARVHTHVRLHRLNQQLEAMVEARTRDLSESEARVRVLIENAPEAIFVFDADQNCYIDANPAAEALTGRPREALCGIHPVELYAPAQPDGLYPEVSIRHNTERALAGEEVITERVIVRPDGRRVRCELRIVALPASGKRLLRSSFVDISDRKTAEERIAFLAYHDTLTGLANQSGMYETLRRMIDDTQLDQQRLAVVLLDLDNFKYINDAHGHRVGDILLTQVAERLKLELPVGTFVARQGGDEFLFALEDCGDGASVQAMAEKVAAVIAEPYHIHGQLLSTSASIGISLCPDDGVETSELLRYSDMAMYKAKESGGGVRRFDAQMNLALLNRISLEADLRQAIAGGQLRLVYQPQLDIASDQVIGLEALVRWQHPDKGLISPADFIPIAEQTGLIVPLGLWTLKEACRQIKLWHDAGLDWLRVAVNLSGAQCQDAGLVPQLRDILAQAGVDARHLELEITESHAMASPDEAIALMHALVELGISISIDDFGTGYSSLAYLKRFPIKKLKIDRSFVKDIETDENDAALCDITTLLAHRLGLKVVAEGVENEAQLIYLQGTGCEMIQGYHFCRPLPANDVEAFIRGRTPKPIETEVTYFPDSTEYDPHI